MASILAEDQPIRRMAAKTMFAVPPHGGESNVATDRFELSTSRL